MVCLVSPYANLVSAKEQMEENIQLAKSGHLVVLHNDHAEILILYTDESLGGGVFIDVCLAAGICCDESGIQGPDFYWKGIGYVAQANRSFALPGGRIPNCCLFPYDPVLA